MFSFRTLTLYHWVSENYEQFLRLSDLWRWSRFHVDVYQKNTGQKNLHPKKSHDVENIWEILRDELWLYINVEAAPSPQVRQVQKRFIIFWSSMVKRQIAKIQRLGFDSPLEVRFFFLCPSLVRIRYSYIFLLTIQLSFNFITFL